MKDIQVFQPSLGKEELAAVEAVFKSNWIGRGAKVKEFEKRWAQYLGVFPAQVRSISSATEGLFQIIQLLGLKRGDEVILPTISFVGAANAIAASGATPVFCDVNRHTLNPNLDDILDCTTKKTKAVILLHYGGLPCFPVTHLHQHLPKIPLIEDSACSPSSTIMDYPCGTFGDFGVWSFDAMKIMSAGDGGMVYFADSKQAEKFDRATYLGLGSSGQDNPADRWWEFQIDCSGRRSIMNDITASIGMAQLDKLQDFTSRRREIHYQYQHRLLGCPWLKLPPDYIGSSHYLYWVQTKYRDRLARHLRDRGIYTTFRYYPLHLVKLYGSKAKLPEAEWAAKNTLCLPIHQGMSDADVERVILEVKKFGKKL